jgi:hypothetical protein
MRTVRSGEHQPRVLGLRTDTVLRYGCVLTVAVCHFRFLRAFPTIASSRTQPFITDMRGRGGGAAAAAAAPSTSLSKCRTGQESRSESSSSSNSSSSSDQEQDSEQHSHTGRAPDSVSADREGGASSGAMAREKHRLLRWAGLTLFTPFRTFFVSVKGA